MSTSLLALIQSEGTSSLYSCSDRLAKQQEETRVHLNSHSAQIIAVALKCITKRQSLHLFDHPDKAEF